jgi:hypothetical protein
MANIRKTNDNACWQGCGGNGIFVHWWWERKLIIIMENYMAVPQKLKMELPYGTAIPLLYTYLKDLNQSLEAWLKR